MGSSSQPYETRAFSKSEQADDPWGSELPIMGGMPALKKGEVFSLPVGLLSASLLKIFFKCIFTLKQSETYRCVRHF